jgi:hypothetical protein
LVRKIHFAEVLVGVEEIRSSRYGVFGEQERDGVNMPPA